MVALELPTLTTIVLTAAVDSINPCAIGVLILLLSTLLVTKRKADMFKIGALYISAIFVTYFAFGLGLVAFMASIPIYMAQYISIAVATLVVFAGLFEIKDYFWYGKGFSLMIPKKYAIKIKEKMQKLSVSTVVFLGIFVAAVELPCTGGPYLAITLILSQNFNMSALILLVIYNIIFVAPLVVIWLMVMLGGKVQDVQKWKQSNKGYMRLFAGLILIALGWFLMMLAGGIINLN